MPHNPNYHQTIQKECQLVVKNSLSKVIKLNLMSIFQQTLNNLVIILIKAQIKNYKILLTKVNLQ